MNLPFVVGVELQIRWKQLRQRLFRPARQRPAPSPRPSPPWQYPKRVSHRLQVHTQCCQATASQRLCWRHCLQAHLLPSLHRPARKVLAQSPRASRCCDHSNPTSHRLQCVHPQCASCGRLCILPLCLRQHLWRGHQWMLQVQVVRSRVRRNGR